MELVDAAQLLGIQMDDLQVGGNSNFQNFIDINTTRLQKRKALTYFFTKGWGDKGAAHSPDAEKEEAGS